MQTDCVKSDKQSGLISRQTAGEVEEPHRSQSKPVFGHIQINWGPFQEYAMKQQSWIFRKPPLSVTDIAAAN